MDVVRKLILEKLAEAGLKMSEASTKIGRNHAYLQQFLKRGVPVELPERERDRLAELLRISPDDLRGPSNPLAARGYERKQNVSSRDSLVDQGLLPAHSAQGASPKVVQGAELFGMQADLPVYGTAQGGPDGAEIVSDYAVDYVARPAVLLKVRDGYGMIVTGDSMSPEHKAGSIALVNPHLPPRPGDSCVFRSHGEDGTSLALIKEYRGQSDTEWKVRQHNPQKDFKLKKSDWQVAHRAVGNYFP
jgi:phage repressor protein C with HTH and peptisase S24 domain